MRTKTTRQAEVLAFQKLPTRSILWGATRELWKRYETDVMIFGFWLMMTYEVWRRIA